MLDWPRRIGSKLGFAQPGGGKLYVPPRFRAMHVDDPLRRPDPVVLLHSGDLSVLAVDEFMVPLHSGEVHAPLLPVARRSGTARELTQGFPRECDLDTPAAIHVGWIVE